MPAICALFLLLFSGMNTSAEEPAPSEKKDAAAPEKKEEPATPAADKKEAPAAAVEKKPAGPPPAYPLKSEWFSQVADLMPDDKQGGDVDEAQQVEQHALMDVLTALQASSDQHLKNSVDNEAKFRPLMMEAEKFRGHVVQVRGTLEVSERFPLPENSLGISEVYRGQLSNITGQIYSFICIERPSPELMKHPVRVTGVFLKRYAFKNRLAGTKLTWTPLVIARNVKEFSEADVPTRWSSMTSLLVGLLCLLLVARILMSFRTMRQRQARDNPFTRKRLAAEKKSDLPRPN
jgi:hypothetical protein